MKINQNKSHSFQNLTKPPTSQNKMTFLNHSFNWGLTAYMCKCTSLLKSQGMTMHFSGLCWFFFFFCHTQQLVGSKFPIQGLNPDPGQWVWSPNHWTARKLIPCWFIFKAIICNSSKRQNILSCSLSSHLRKWLLMWGRDRKEQCNYHPPMKCCQGSQV